MKKVLMVALLIVGMTSFAQVRKAPENRKAQMEQLSPEQRNELQLKKLTLDLNLNASQQNEMKKIIAEQTAKREARMAERNANKDKAVKPKANERFARKNQMLDEQIAMKQRVSKVLSAEQMEKWEQMKTDKKRNFKGGKRGNKMVKPQN